MTSRRDFLHLACAGLAVWPRNMQPRNIQPRNTRSTFLDVRRPPDLLTIHTADGEHRLEQDGDEWRANDVRVAFVDADGGLRVRLSAPASAVDRLHLRWRGDTDRFQLLLGDAWERAYGDLEWRGGVPDRAMPWYCAALDGDATHAYGVRTGPRAFCYWQIDPEGINLFADVRSGGAPVQLGPRTLDVCDVVCREGRAGESAFAALHAFCRDICREPRRLAQPAYGSND